tara:strand:+ start:6055 stop:6708 length:654 start_codon:yes stop_codon:yes gene_type:complete
MSNLLKNFLSIKDDKNQVSKLKSLIRFENLNKSEKRLNEMYEYSKMPEFYDFLETEPHKNITETSQYLDNLINRETMGYYDGQSRYWFIIDSLEDKLIGTIGLVGIKDAQSHACTTMGLSPSYRSNGRGIEATLSLLHYGFTNLKLNKIWAITHELNKPVIKLHNLFGFKTEGIIRDYYYLNNEYTNACYLGCLKNEYTPSKSISIIALSRKIGKQL